MEAENNALKQRVEILERLLQETPGKSQPEEITPLDDSDLEAKVEELRAEIDKLRRENIKKEPQPNPTPSPESNFVYVDDKKISISPECRTNDKLIDAFRAGIENYLRTRVDIL